MTIKKSMLLAGILLVLVSLFGNYAVFSANQLKAPVMLKHFYFKEMMPGNTIDIYYITNRNEEMKIEYATVPGQDSIQLLPSEWDLHTFGHHKFKHLSFELNESNIDEIGDTSWSFNQINAVLSNGESVLLDVGKVEFFEMEPAPLSFRSSGSSSDGTGYALIEADEPVELTGFQLPFPEKLTSALSIHMNQQQLELNEYVDAMIDTPIEPAELPEGDVVLTQDLFPLSIKKGEFLSLQYKWDFQPDDKNRLHYYDVSVQLNGRDEHSEPFTHTTMFNYQPYFTEESVKEVIQEVKQ